MASPEAANPMAASDGRLGCSTVLEEATLLQSNSNDQDDHVVEWNAAVEMSWRLWRCRRTCIRISVASLHARFPVDIFKTVLRTRR
jgi:hypothetical protein